MTGVAVCIPVLNEREGIATVLPRLARALACTPYTICIVDDGSTDGTLAWLDDWRKDHSSVHVLRRQRKGAGCLRGAATREGLQWLLAHTGHEVFVDLDADGSQRPEEIPIALDYLAANPACEVVVASKYVAGSEVHGRPLFRRLGSRTYNALLRVGLDMPLRDFSNSFRFYRRSAAECVVEARTRHDTPVFLIEMLAIWHAAGLRIDELPTRYDTRHGGRSKVGLRDALRGFAQAGAVVATSRRGGYSPAGNRHA